MWGYICACLPQALFDLLLDQFERTPAQITIGQSANPLGHIRSISVDGSLVCSMKFADRLVEFPKTRRLFLDERRYGICLLGHCFVEGNHAFTTILVIAGRLAQLFNAGAEGGVEQI